MLAFPQDGWYIGIVRIIRGSFQHTLQHARPSCPLSGVQTKYHPLRDDAKVAVAEIVFWMSTEGVLCHLGYGVGRLVPGVRSRRGDLWPGKERALDGRELDIDASRESDR